MPLINSKQFKKLHNIPSNYTLSLKDISIVSDMPLKALQEVFNKGVGAYYTNPTSVRPQVRSAEQWAFARVYSFVMKRKTTFYGADKHIAEKYGLL
jgi:hypothetical protein